MSEYREDLIPVEYILHIAEGTAFKMASISLLALVDNWRRCGKEWCEEIEEAQNEA